MQCGIGWHMVFSRQIGVRCGCVQPGPEARTNVKESARSFVRVGVPCSSVIAGRRVAVQRFLVYKLKSGKATARGLKSMHLPRGAWPMPDWHGPSRRFCCGWGADLAMSSSKRPASRTLSNSSPALAYSSTRQRCVGIRNTCSRVLWGGGLGGAPEGQRLSRADGMYTVTQLARSGTTSSVCMVPGG